MLFRVAHAQKAQRPHLPQDLPRHHAIGFPGLAVRHDCLGHETPQLVAYQAQILGQVDRIMHICHACCAACYG